MSKLLMVVKKIAAVLLIGLLLFNWVGYNLVVNYLQHKSDAHLEVLLDEKKYDESQLIELKIPTHLPYQTSWASYERYDGEVEMNGVMYKYVKRKVSNDTLYLMCLPNTKKMTLETARNDFFKNTNDLAQNNHTGKTPGSKSLSFKNSISDYDAYAFIYNFNKSYRLSQQLHISYQDHTLLFAPHVSPEQPPDCLVA